MIIMISFSGVPNRCNRVTIPWYSFALVSDLRPGNRSISMEQVAVGSPRKLPRIAVEPASTSAKGLSRHVSSPAWFEISVQAVAADGLYYEVSRAEIDFDDSLEVGNALESPVLVVLRIEVAQLREHVDETDVTFLPKKLRGDRADLCESCRRFIYEEPIRC